MHHSPEELAEDLQFGRGTQDAPQLIRLAAASHYRRNPGCHGLLPVPNLASTLACQSIGMPLQWQDAFQAEPLDLLQIGQSNR